jgi:hypothetical protein
VESGIGLSDRRSTAISKLTKKHGRLPLPAARKQERQNGAAEVELQCTTRN